MAEVFASFDTPLRDELGEYHVRVVGRHADDGMWEGWLEFVPIARSAEPLIGSVESRQPERHDLAYWAGGLTPVFLEGALRRARRPLTVHARAGELPPSDASAPRPPPTPRPPPRRPAAAAPDPDGRRVPGAAGRRAQSDRNRQAQPRCP